MSWCVSLSLSLSLSLSGPRVGRGQHSLGRSGRGRNITGLSGIHPGIWLLGFSSVCRNSQSSSSAPTAVPLSQFGGGCTKTDCAGLQNTAGAVHSSAAHVQTDTC